jgi:monoamine oxidase
MTLSLSRRQFIKQTAMAASALAAPPIEIKVPAELARPFSRKGDAKKIIILGAGLAGLSSGYELSRAGHDVTLLEARTRPGGRVYTLREPFADGLYVDTGASSLPSSHHFVMKYVKEFGLTLVPWLQPELASLGFIFYMRGRRIRPGDGTKIPYQLLPEERQMGTLKMVEKYFNSVVPEIGDPLADNWPPPSLDALDRMTVRELMLSRGASPDAVEFLGIQFYLDLPADGMAETSALYLLRDSRLTPDSDTIYKIEGGMDQLPKAFAAKLADKIYYGSPAVRIEHDDREVRVFFSQAGRTEKITGDRLICTLPFSVLRHLEVAPDFSPEKRRAINELPYASTSRIFLQCRKRFWLDEKLSGFASTDLPIMFIFDSTSAPDGPRGLLEVYASGARGRQLDELARPERVTFAVEQMAKVHPAIRDYFEGGADMCWQGEEWSRGAYSYYRPGQVQALHPHVARAEGRVHFAGEHTSSWPHWMQGALQSALRTVREVNEA